MHGWRGCVWIDRRRLIEGGWSIEDGGWSIEDEANLARIDCLQIASHCLQIESKIDLAFNLTFCNLGVLAAPHKRMI
jgi:hypothetical protein